MSLRYRIALTIFILEALVMSVVLWQTLSYSDQSIRKQVATSQEVTLNLLSNLARIALFIEEYDELVNYISYTEKDPSVVRVLVANHNNIVVVSSDISLMGKAMPTSSSQPNRYISSATLANAAGMLGTIAIEFSNERLVKARQEAFKLGWSIALSGMLVIAVIGILMGHLLTRRLKVLQESAEEFAKGDLQQRADIQGNDEIARLGMAFNAMAGSLSRQFSDLQNSKNELRVNNEELIRTSEELENIRLHLEDLVQDRTQELQITNQELDAFCYSVSHDLRAPLRTITSFTQIILEDYTEKLDGEGQSHLTRVIKASQRMAELIDDLLQLSRLSRSEIRCVDIDVVAMVHEVLTDLQLSAPQRTLKCHVEPGIRVWADPRLFRVVLENILSNAWKYTRNQKQAQIEVGSFNKDGGQVVFVRDNGAGFNMEYVHNLFKPFQRLHQETEFEGTGIGLATVQRVVHRHRGKIWAEAEVGAGATFYIQLPAVRERSYPLPKQAQSGSLLES